MNLSNSLSTGAYEKVKRGKEGVGKIEDWSNRKKRRATWIARFFFGKESLGPRTATSFEEIGWVLDYFAFSCDTRELETRFDTKGEERQNA